MRRARRYLMTPVHVPRWEHWLPYVLLYVGIVSELLWWWLRR
jgi:hypothetical protein